MTASEVFKSRFQHIQNTKRVFVPYRVCPVGAHIDHQKGIVTGFALDKGVEFVYAPSNGSEVKILSCNFDTAAEFSPAEELIKTQSWGDYAKAAAWALKNGGYNLQNGFYGVINGELSAGGLSSSAAVIISYLNAFCSVNRITLTADELITIAHTAETKFIGLNCGTLDQSCEVLCRKNSLLVLDTLDSSYSNIPCSKAMPDFEVAVFFSGLTRSLTSSNYNLRTQELKDAVKALKEYSGISTAQDVLREIPYEVYQSFSTRLPENQRRRCEHYYGEMCRVKIGTDSFKNGDISEFGKSIFESGLSSIKNYEAGSPELIKLYEIMRETNGIYGGRFSGAGFKGCCMAIINPGYKEEIAYNVKKEYIRAFPSLADKFSVHFCKTADGCKKRKD